MSTDAEDHVRYVIAGMPTGWAAINKTIREVDEDKIKDYKEDIDTLLVFTGLFSAVLTAFVIVSFPMLSPDKQDTAIQHLAQISAQTNSYTVATGAMNSTVAPLFQSSAPFEPSLAALRVNYLWFASFIITLVTASFSMLVKQWLREYLALEYTFPQQRLRARQFRHPGLAIWKVYEIAGLLPLLLQLALGLFFLGLCFFTRSENHGIGDMCAALVALWASFFATATMAPAFSARCPYKTPFLKPIMVALRRHHVMRTLWRNIVAFLTYLTYLIVTAIFYFLSVNLILGRRLADNARRIGLWRSMNMFLTSLTYAIVTCSFHLMSTGLILCHRLKDHVLSASLILYHRLMEYLSPPVPPDEEQDAIKKDDDLILLREVDEFLLNDDLLGTAMLDALTQSDVEPLAIIKFVLHTMSSRLKIEGNALQQPFTFPPDLRRLSRRCQIAISDIVAASILSDSRTETATESWIQDAVYLLLSNSEQLSSSRAVSTLLRCIRKSTLSHIALGLAASLVPSTFDRFHVLLTPIEKRLHTLLTHNEVESSDIITFMVTLITAGQAVPPLPLISTLDLQSASEPVWKFSSTVLGKMIEHSIGPDRVEREIGSWLESAINIILSRTRYPMTLTGNKILARLCSEDSVRERFGSRIRSLAFHDSDTFGHVLSRLHEVCKNITAPESAHWLLKEIAHSLTCQGKCTHSADSIPTLASLMAQNPPYDEEWTEQFTSILVERSTAVLTKMETDWPPGSEQSLQTLMSLPVSSRLMNPKIPEVVFAVIRDTRTTALALQPLVSVNVEQRVNIVSDNAMQCITSLVAGANTEDRLELVDALWDTCDDYTYLGIRESYPGVGTINPAGFLALGSKIYDLVQAADEEMVRSWAGYYSACAEAMSIFRTTTYSGLPDPEKAETVRIAEECLVTLDRLELAPRDLDEWETNFDDGTNIFPDALFEELVAFVNDADAAARKSWRIQRLRKRGVIPGGELSVVNTRETPHDANELLAGNQESAGNACFDEDGGFLSDECSSLSLRADPSSSSPQIEGVRVPLSDDAPRSETSLTSSSHDDTISPAHEAVESHSSTAGGNDQDTATLEGGDGEGRGREGSPRNMDLGLLTASTREDPEIPEDAASGGGRRHPVVAVLDDGTPSVRSETSSRLENPGLPASLAQETESTTLHSTRDHPGLDRAIPDGDGSLSDEVPSGSAGPNSPWSLMHETNDERARTLGNMEVSSDGNSRSSEAYPNDPLLPPSTHEPYTPTPSDSPP